MTECEHILTELQEKVTKWKSTGEAALKTTKSQIAEWSKKNTWQSNGVLGVQEAGTDDDKKRFAELELPRKL